MKTIKETKEKIRASKKYQKVVNAIRKVINTIKSAVVKSVVATIIFIKDIFAYSSAKTESEAQS